MPDAARTGSSRRRDRHDFARAQPDTDLLPESAELVVADDLPGPYERLLVRDEGLTRTLERLHQSRMRLEVLRRRPDGDRLWRQIVLIDARTERRCAFATIRIRLAGFSPAARDLILGEELPLGHVLRRSAMAHTREPVGYFRAAPDRTVAAALCLASGGPALFGRIARIHDAGGSVLATAAEILPPLPPAMEIG